MPTELIYIKPDPLLDKPEIELAKPYSVSLQLIPTNGVGSQHSVTASGNAKVRAIVARQFFSQVRRISELRPGDKIAACLDDKQVRAEVLDCKEAL